MTDLSASSEKALYRLTAANSNVYVNNPEFLQQPISKEGSILCEDKGEDNVSVNGSLARSGNARTGQAKSTENTENTTFESIRSGSATSLKLRYQERAGYQEEKNGVDWRLTSWWKGCRKGRSGRQEKECQLEKRSSEEGGQGLEGMSGAVDVDDATEDAYPDGGPRAWLVVFGAACDTFATFGYINSWGVFQAYYQTTLLPNSSPSDIAWIGSTQYAFVYVPGLLVGRLFDLGYFYSFFLTCSAILVLSTFLVAECTVYWHFLLCQGIAVGLACGGIFGPVTSIIAHWFKRKRGKAIAFVSIGASIGSMVLPIAAKNLIDQVGFKWTMRIMGFILFFTLCISALTLKRRLPPADVPGGILSPSAFRSAPYMVYCLSMFTTFLGTYTVSTYIDVSAQAISGLAGTKLSFYLVSIANGAAMVGKYASGIICDRAGPMNAMIPFTVVAAIVTFAWPYARSTAAIVAVAVLYGVSSGAYVTLISNPIMELGDTSDVGRRLGMSMSILAVGALVGPPISGAIDKATGGFEAVGFYAGSMILLGAATMTLMRWIVLRRWWGRL